MSVIELKSQIINKVSSINDELILEEIYKLVNTESEIDVLYQLSDLEKNAVVRGLQDIEKGKVMSSEHANSLIKEWLKK